MEIRRFLATAALLVGAGISPHCGSEDLHQGLDLEHLELYQAHRQLNAGRGLSQDAAEALEQQLKDDPQRQAIRVELIGYYDKFGRDSESRNRRTEHVIWLTKNEPAARVLATYEAEIDQFVDADAYLEARSAWNQHVENMPDDLNVLRNAAGFFRLSDPKLAIELFERAQRIDDLNPEWAIELGRLYGLEMVGSDGESVPDVAAKVLDLFESAYELSEGTGRGHLLEDLAKAAFAAGKTEQAREYADAMLSNAPDDWNFGNRIHHGHLTLGRIALAEGNLEKAKARLLMAGQTPGSPQLNSFGPNMALARDLLGLGEREVVLNYFELCSKFWNTERLADWTVLAKEGRMPDFGANLIY